MKPKFTFSIDLLGACNLRCPSCPQGQQIEKNPQGFMPLRLMEKIADKALSECDVVSFELFNWTEPLLHPELPEFITLLHSKGIKSDISSNLNRLPDPVALMRANPFRFRISASGFTQPVYSQTHRGGDIETVKVNMRRLAQAKKEAGATTLISVLFHRYRHNLHEEKPLRDYARSLGFQFFACTASMMPVEKVVSYYDASIPNLEDSKLLNNLLVPLYDALPVTKTKSGPCLIQTEKIALDFRGNVKLCCGVYSSRYNVGNYLELPIEEIQRRRTTSDFCARCAKAGAYQYSTDLADREMEKLALVNLDSKRRSILSAALRKEKTRRFLEGISRRIFSVETSARLGALFDAVTAKK